MINSNVKHFSLLVIIFTLLVVPQMSTARPSQASSLNSVDTCKIDSKIQETCQRCAKITKSNVVYPMCCDNEDDVYNWCEKYINFGIH